MQIVVMQTGTLISFIPVSSVMEMDKGNVPKGIACICVQDVGGESIQHLTELKVVCMRRAPYTHRTPL